MSKTVSTNRNEYAIIGRTARIRRLAARRIRQFEGLIYEQSDFTTPTRIGSGSSG